MSRNLGDPVVSSATSRLEIPGDQLQASTAHSSAGERNERVHPRYRQAKLAIVKEKEGAPRRM